MVIYGEKMNNNKYNDGNFKVYSDYLIQDPSKYGIRDTYHKTNQNDVPVNCEDWGSKVHFNWMTKFAMLNLLYKGN